MNASHRISFALMLSLAIMILVSCNKKCDIINDPLPPIEIGVLLPLTGSGSSTGESSLLAIEYAVEDINNYLANTNYPTRVQTYVRDTETDTFTAITKFNELNSKGIYAVIGPYSSASVKAIKSIADDHNILTVSPSSVATSLAIEDDYIFRLAPSDQFQAEAMNAMLKDKGIKAIVPIVRNDLWGNELIASLTGTFNQAGGVVITPSYYDPGSQDFMHILNDLNTKTGNVSGIYSPGEVAVYMVSFAEGTLILNQGSAFSHLQDVQWFGSSAFAENKTLLSDITAAGFAMERELLCPIFGYDEMARDKWEPLVQKLKVNLNRKPEIYALNAYDAIWLITNAIFKTRGDGNNINFRPRLKNMFIEEADNYYGVTGRTTLNAAGDRAIAFYDFWKIEKDGNDYDWKLAAKYNNTTGELNWE